jgi:hypothetical protein
MSKKVNEMSAEEILGNRKWPAWFTTEQMRKQLQHEENGCPVPFKGAVWNPIGYFE